MRHRADIQGLRAVAVLLVALNHAGIPFLKGGYVGVDVFFVLSGFLITGILLSQAQRNGHVSLTEFYVRRARRILPAAVLTLVVTSIAAHHLLNFVRARSVVEDSIWASFFAANIHFANQGSDYFAQGQPPSPILHFWSLAAEEQFYLVWPTVLSLVLFGALHRPAPAPSPQRGVAADPTACCASRAGRDRPGRDRVTRLVDSLHRAARRLPRTSPPPRGRGSWLSGRGSRSLPRLRERSRRACRSPWAGRASAPWRAPPSSSPPAPRSRATPRCCRPWARRS